MGTIQAASGLFNTLTSAAGSVSEYLPEPVAEGIDFAQSLTSARQGIEIDVSPAYQDLIDKQIETQQELQQVTFTSNIERSEHETRMAAIRNVRVA